MSSSTSVTTGISWSELPEGPLTDIANRMDTEFDVIRLRAVCKSWRSSLSSHPSKILGSNCPNFPLNLPILIPPAAASSTASLFPPSQYTLHQTTIYSLSPAWDNSVLPWMIRVSESKPRTFSLMFPLTGKKVDHLPDHLPKSINLLNFRISRITHLYHVETVGVTRDLPRRGMPSLIKKVVLTNDFFETGDRVLLASTATGKLALWRFGDENWTWITTEGRDFNDITSSRGKFYATSDNRGGLVMIDSRLQPFQLVKDLMYGSGWIVHLVECGSNLFLVDQVGGATKFSFSLFKLDDKSRFWDYELQMEDERVIFLCSDGNFSISMADFAGCAGNCICFSRRNDEVLVFDLVKNMIAPSDIHASLLWPPPSWIRRIPSSTLVEGSLFDRLSRSLSETLLPPLQIS